MWTTHLPGSCGRADKHVPSKYDPIAHETQWNKKNNNNSTSTSTQSKSNSSNNNIGFKLDSKLQTALCTISNGDDFDAAAFLATYGIEDEESKK